MKILRLALGDRKLPLFQTLDGTLKTVVYGVAGFPLFWVTSLIAKYVVNFPFYDGWLVGVTFHTWVSNQLHFWDLFRQHNESRKFFPRILLTGLAKLTQWDTRYENILIVLLLVLISYGLYRLLKATIPKHPWLVAIAWGCMNLLICSPLQYENLLWGLQYIMFVVPACLIGILLLCQSNRPLWQQFLGWFAYCFFATFTFANGLVLWIVAIMPISITILCKQSRLAWGWMAAWLASFAGILVFYFYDYTKPADSPSLLAGLANPGAVIQYFASFLGAPLSFLQLSVSPTMGVLLLGLFGILSLGTIAYLRQPKNQLSHDWIAPDDWRWTQPILPWLTLAAYSLLSGGLAAAGRAGFGLAQSLSPRYITVSSYLCVAIVGLGAVSLAIAIDRWSLKSRDPAASQPHAIGDWWRSAPLPLKLSYAIALFLLTIGLVLQLKSYQAGLGGMQDFNRQVRLGRACAILSPILEDSPCIQKIHPDRAFTQENLPRMNALGLLHPPLIKTRPIESFGTTELGDAAQGNWESWQWQSNVQFQPHQPQLSHPESPHWVAKGWAILKQAGRPADAVILAVRNPKTGLHRPIAIAWVVKSRGKIAKRFGRDFWVAGWEAALTPEQLPQNPRELSAWAFDSSIPRAYKLPQTYQWPGRTQPKSESSPTTGTPPAPPQP